MPQYHILLKPDEAEKCWTCGCLKGRNKIWRDGLEEYEITCEECFQNEYPELCGEESEESEGEESEGEESEESECGRCGECGVELDHFRDGTEEDGQRCHNCYWSCPYTTHGMRAKDIAPLIYPDYRIKQ